MTKLKAIIAFAAFTALSSPSYAQDTDIIFRYGESFDAVLVERWAATLNRHGIKASAEAGLNSPECVAIIKDGSIVEVYQSGSRHTRMIPVLAKRIHEGENILKARKGDCPE